MFAFLLRRRHVLVALLAVRHHRLSVIRKILCHVNVTQHLVQMNVDNFDFTLRAALPKRSLKLHAQAHTTL